MSASARSETVVGTGFPLTLAIIGAGRAGRALAAEAVRAGHHVILEDVLPSKLRLALEDIAIAQNTGALDLVETVEDAVRHADLVIDFVPDELESKLEIISMVDRMAPPKTMLCIPTRELSIADLASCTYRPELCMGASIGDGTVELLACARTSAGTVMKVERFWMGLGYSVTVKTEEPVG